MHRHDAGCYRHTFPLFHSMWWYAYHACLCRSLAFYASLYTCLHVHAWFLLASVLSMLKHNEVMDIRSKPTFVRHGHHLLLASCLFVFFLACLLAFLSCQLSCLSIYLVACQVSCHILHLPRLPCLSCLFALCLFHILFASFSFHCLSTGFLPLALHVHT